MYGNVIKISTESSPSILSLCEVEVYADAYGRSQRNEPLASYFVKHSILNNLSQMIDGVFQGSQMEYIMLRNKLKEGLKSF